MKQEKIRIVGKGLDEDEIQKLLFFVKYQLQKQIVAVEVRYHGS